MSEERMSLINGLMQPWSMTVDKILVHAQRWHGAREVVSFRDDGVEERQSYADLLHGAKRLSRALLASGVRPGDRVATLAMNGSGHFIAWYAISGIGAICHTLNPRLGESRLEWIANHAGDSFLFADGALSELAETLAARTPSIRDVVYFTEPRSGCPAGRQLLETYLADVSAECAWGGFDENTAAGLCYTSGTTGDPKGVLYSHRSNVLHTLISAQPDVFALSAQDVIMPVVPMYHANAWGLVFSAPAVGAKLVLPGARLDGPTLYARLKQEGVTFAAGVPTAWLGLLDHMEAIGGSLPALTRVVVGGSAMSEQLMRRFDALGITAIAVWGMTEMSPVGGVATPTPEVAAMGYDDRIEYRLKQGRAPFGIDARIVDETGKELPHDGWANGAIEVSGPAVTCGYYKLDRAILTQDGWLNTGDIGTLDRFGYLKITDREKDIIKSGGEWISSIDIENAAGQFPGVALSAVVGLPHPRWDERPLLLVTTKDGAEVDTAKLKEHLALVLPKWWLPDDIRVTSAIPLGATGKIDKRALRAELNIGG